MGKGETTAVIVAAALREQANMTPEVMGAQEKRAEYRETFVAYVQELTKLRDRLKADIRHLRHLPLHEPLPLIPDLDSPNEDTLPTEDQMEELREVLGGECGRTRAITRRKDLLLSQIDQLKEEYREVRKDWEVRVAQADSERRTRREPEMDVDSLETSLPGATSSPKSSSDITRRFARLSISPQREDKGSTHQSYPMITVGNTEVHIPLPLGLMKELKDMCPNPKKDPRAAAMFLQKYTAGSLLTMDDIQIILSAIDPDTASQFDLDKIKTEASMKEGEDEEVEEGPKVWKKFWDKIGVAWMKRYKGDSGLHTMLNTKQEPKEDFYSFCKRLLDIYSSTGMNAPELFKTTCMTNGGPKTTQLIKLVNNDWLTQSVTEFMDDIAKRSASGVFNQRGGVFPMLVQQDSHTEPTENNYMMVTAFTRGGNYVRGPRNRGQVNHWNRERTTGSGWQGQGWNSGGCFICGSPGHWRRECPAGGYGDRGGYRKRGGFIPRGRPPNNSPRQQEGQQGMSRGPPPGELINIHWPAQDRGNGQPNLLSDLQRWSWSEHAQYPPSRGNHSY